MIVVCALLISVFPAGSRAEQQLSFAIEPSYGGAAPFIDGMAAVEQQGKWGYIDTKGTLAVPFQYDMAQNFTDGLAVIGTRTQEVRKFGVINNKGDKLTSISYDDATILEGGYVIVRVKGQSDNVWVDGKVGLVGRTGELLPPVYESITGPNEGVFIIQKGGLYGYVDAKGKPLTELIYSEANSFSDGLALVKWDGKAGFLNHQGEIRFVTDNPSDYSHSFSEGLVSFRQDGKVGYMDTFGNITISPKYREAWPFDQGLAFVRKDDKWGYIDHTGKVVIPFRYDDTASRIQSGLVLVANGEDYIPQASADQHFGKGNDLGYKVLSTKKYGFVNTKGEEVVPLRYDYADDFVRGYAKVGKAVAGADGDRYKYGYIDVSGQEVVPLRYDFVGGDLWDGYRGFTEGLSPVSNGGKGEHQDYEGGRWGYVNHKGQEVTPLSYTYAWSFSEGMGRVEKDGKHGFVDASGKLVIPCIYEDADDFKNGIALVQKDGKLGYIDVTGRELTGMVYASGKPFIHGTALVQLESTRKMGYLRNPLPEVAPVRAVFESQGEGQPALVTLTTNTEQAIIYYTTDNKDPLRNLVSATTQQYTGPFPLGKSATIQAIAVAKGMQNSPLASIDYKQSYTPSSLAAPEEPDENSSPALDKPQSPKEDDLDGFTDLADHWAKLSILWAVDKKIVSGYPDRTFRPNQRVTEPEFLKMLLGAYPDIAVKTDEGATWHAPFFQAAEQQNWPLLRETDGTRFNRGQVARLLAATQGFAFDHTKDAVQYVLDRSIAGGKTSATVEGFATEDALSRAEAMTLIQNLKVRGFKLVKADIKPNSQSAEFIVRGLAIGDTEKKVIDQLGEPARKDISEYGFFWYIYNQDYANYVQVGVQDGKVVALYSNSDNWSSTRKIKLGSPQSEVTKAYGSGEFRLQKEGKSFYLSFDNTQMYQQAGSYVTLFLDKHAKNTVTAILMVDEAVEDGMMDYYPTETEELRTAYERQNVDLVNAIRTRFGLAPVQEDKLAAKVAREHSEDMRNRKYFAHENYKGQQPDDRFKAARLPYSSVGENIAANQRNIIFAHEAWMNSKGHRENILSDWQRLGVGVAFNKKDDYHPMDRDSNMYYTQNFFNIEGKDMEKSYQQKLGEENEKEAAKESLKTYPFDDSLFELYVHHQSEPGPDGSRMSYYGFYNKESFTLPPYSAIYVTAGTSFVKFEEDYYNYNYGGKLVAANHSAEPKVIKAKGIDYTKLEQIYRSEMGTVTDANGKSVKLTATGPYVRLVQFKQDFDESKDYKSYIDQNAVMTVRPWVTVKPQ
ncbi:WG repeat-containing protein [Paenibacillus filicis]|uniref:WG repeat-containing protein n=1 Tax=Paenibacillus filicis TaxID=669464 RepID=A0ABU9DJU9_9BACL